jgi:hypothetical protein
VRIKGAFHDTWGIKTWGDRTMERYRHRLDAEVMQVHFTWIPQRIRSWLSRVPLVTGYDPGWLGLHYSRETGDGRWYGETAHVVYPEHQLHLPRDRRETTIVLPGSWVYSTGVVLHELGHVLDYRLGLSPSQTSAPGSLRDHQRP